MQVNKISNINFKSYKINNISKDAEAQNAILMLRDPKASIKFQQNQEFAQNADSVASNPLKALGYKLYRTFSMIKVENAEEEASDKTIDAVA